MSAETWQEKVAQYLEMAKKGISPEEASVVHRLMLEILADGQEYYLRQVSIAMSLGIIPEAEKITDLDSRDLEAVIGLFLFLRRHHVLSLATEAGSEYRLWRLLEALPVIGAEQMVRLLEPQKSAEADELDFGPDTFETD